MQTRRLRQVFESEERLQGPGDEGRPAPRPRLLLGHCRAILMKTKNRHYLSFWSYGKRQLYGRAVESVQV